jgi:O-antigen/teichoic acid export membrane protein
VRDRSDTILIGRMLDPTQVGIYSIGAELAALPTTELIEPFGRVAFSGFAAARNAEIAPAETYLRLIATMSLLTLPAAVGIALIADPLVNLAFGPLWAAAVPLVQILALAGVPMVVGVMSATLFAVHALLPQIFSIGLASVLLRVALLIVFIGQFGLYGAAIAAAIAICVEQGLYVLLTMRQIALKLTQLVHVTWRALLATATMAAVLLRTGLGEHIAGASPAALARQLAVAVFVGAAVYTTVLLAAWFAAGRPAGAETDVLALARRMFGRLGSALWAR